MFDAARLTELFPREEDIPAEHRLLAPIHQSSVLVNGALKHWAGKVRAVRSPICAYLSGRLARK